MSNSGKRPPAKPRRHVGQLEKVFRCGRPSLTYQRVSRVATCLSLALTRCWHRRRERQRPWAEASGKNAWNPKAVTDRFRDKEREPVRHRYGPIGRMMFGLNNKVAPTMVARSNQDLQRKALGWKG